MPNPEEQPISTGPSKQGKKKNKKKKAGAEKIETNGDALKTNGISATQSPTVEEEEEATEDTQTPAEHSPIKQEFPKSNESDITNKLDALAKERDLLRQEVTELRKSLEDIKGKHDQDIEQLKTRAEEAETEKEEAETQHNNLKERVKTITATLGERMRANAEEIAQNNARIEELEESNTQLQSALEDQRQQYESQSREVDGLRGRATLSQQNWVKERDEMISQEARTREEYEEAKQAMQDWEVLAMEERSRRENLADQVTELEEQLDSIREAHDRIASERDTQAQSVEGLQRALRDIQDARKKELRELVESSEAQLEEARKKQQTAEDQALSSKSDLEGVQKELERLSPFEKEVKEKNLLIGKLRHEGVILNDHLTKALRYIKQKNPEDMVDRQVVTNHLLHFLTLERTDAKKFQVLQIIAGYLGWDDDQREKAGLARPGAASMASSLRLPMSPFRKASTTSLNADASMLDQRTPKDSKDSLADLWSDFLEREAAEGLGKSRRGSTASGMTEPRGAAVEDK